MKIIFNYFPMPPVSHTKICVHVSQKYILWFSSTTGTCSTWNITTNDVHSITGSFLLLNINFKLLRGTH